jgi:hypothetical protein
MTFIQFSDEDMKRDAVVEPAWYVLNIQNHRTWSPTKDGQSNNCHYDTIIEKNADNGSVDFAGVPIVLQFNDKPGATGFIKAFLRGLGVELQSKVRYDLNSAVGKKIEAFIENDTYNGRIVNRCNHKYRIHQG